MTAIHEQQYFVNENKIRLWFWMRGDEYDRFEAAIPDDPTVINLERLSEGDGQRLYRVDFTDYGYRFSTYPYWGRYDLSLASAESARDGWELGMYCPGRSDFKEFVRECNASGISVRTFAIREGRVLDAVGKNALTPPQREAVVLAYEEGYFEIPRESSLARLANELEITKQALSERLRRAVAKLIEITCCRD